MNALPRPIRCRLLWSRPQLALTLILLTCRVGVAQTGTLAEPFIAPSPNAALHYQRALLHLVRIRSVERELLESPIWLAVPTVHSQATTTALKPLLDRARFAVQSAATGARISNCNFGIDFQDLGTATQLPHLKGMVELGRLLTLRGVLAESRGEWEEAAIIYFDGLRMGRHLTHQNTLLECLTGLEILQNNYHALAGWSARCPSQPLVARTFGLFESIQGSLVDPAEVLARETSVMAQEFDRLADAYPDGSWAAMVLDSYGLHPTGDRTKDKATARAACIERGVPKEVFDDPKSMHNYLGKLRITANRFAESLSACMTLSPQPRLRRAASLNKKYAKLIPVLSDEIMIDAVEVGLIFAEHEAEVTITRIALAVSATKADDQLPTTLQDVAPRFGGRLPASPYGGPIQYQAQDGRFSLLIDQQGSLPGIDFDSQSPIPAD